MGQMTFIVSDELEKKFRDRIYKKMGMRKGNMVKALEEALEDWIQKK